MFCLFVNALYDMNVTKTNLLLRTFKCQWRINILASNLVREADIELLASAADSGCMQINFASSKIPPVWLLKAAGYLQREPASDNQISSTVKLDVWGQPCNGEEGGGGGG